MSKLSLLLDVSRTVARARLPVPTGIDRVERAYIDWALQRDALFLACVDARQYLLGAETVRTLVGWLDGNEPTPHRDLKAYLRPRRPRRLTQAQSLIRQGAISVYSTPHDLAKDLIVRCSATPVYLNVGHDNCTVDLMQALGDSGVRRLFLLHDTIPLDHPEFARPDTPAKFRKMLDAAVWVDGFIANSAATQAQIPVHMPDADIPSWVAPLGIDVPPRPHQTDHDRPPHFLCIGTIEPRKNHRLLLQVWKRLHQDRAAKDIPHLHIIGRRGWLNEDVFKDLDTLPFIGTTVFETTANDAELAHLMASTRAVLFPSLAEGYGLPLAEALAAGTPVIASDLPALREIGGTVPDYLPPSDVGLWQKMIEDYAMPSSPRRAAQIARLPGWTRPTWKAHFSIVENAIETILVQTHRRR